MPVAIELNETGKGRISRERWEDLADLAQYRAKNLAKLCNWSMRHLQREFRRSFGRAPQGWLNERRLLAARERLLSGEPIKKVAADLGFKQIAHFYHQFKAANQMTPLEFVTSRTAAKSGMSPADKKCRCGTIPRDGRVPASLSKCIQS